MKMSFIMKMSFNYKQLLKNLTLNPNGKDLYFNEIR